MRIFLVGNLKMLPYRLYTYKYYLYTTCDLESETPFMHDEIEIFIIL